MHEVGIVNGILDTVIRAARGAGASTFREEDPITAGCELKVREIHPSSECLDCGIEFEHDRFHCRCPECGGSNIRRIHGREMDIASIEVETPDDPV